MSKIFRPLILKKNAITYLDDVFMQSQTKVLQSQPPELLTRKTTVEIPQNIKFYLAKDETSPRLECKYAVKTDID